MKAGRFAVESPKVEQVEANCGEKKVGRPGGNPCRDAVTFAECKEKVHQKVHRKDKKNRSRNTRYNAPTRVSDSQRGRNADNNETGPRQAKAILQMRAKRRQQRSGKIRIEIQVLPQLR